MEGFLWLLLQMILLLLAAAVVFFILGWRWRGQNALREIAALNSRIDAESATLKDAQDQRDAALSNDHMLRATQTKIESDLQEANDHRRNLERELIRVHDDLKSAKLDTDHRGEDLSAAKLQISTLQEQILQLQNELKTLLSKQPATQSALPESPVKTKKSSPSEKTKPPRKSATSPKSAKVAKPSTDAQATLVRLANEITTQQTLVTALRQEHEDWQRRVSRLREKANDPAGLGLANKSLLRSEVQVAKAQASFDRLQRQQQALLNCLEQAANIGQDDDLTKIKGIKGVLNTQLHAYGIRTFQQIATWTEADVETFSELLAFKDRAKRDQWVQQAQSLISEK